ncbi:MAG TPA: response regulator transcription factor [Gemmatimonadales bacterium]|nr:response regulator transcription factor [Gemmatimonadales bacterium]
MIRVLVVDPHPVVREGVRQAVAGAGDITVVAEAESDEGLLTALRTTPVDVVVLELGTLAGGPLSGIRRIKAAQPAARVLVLTVYREEELALRVLGNGADGCLTKSRTPRELVTAIRQVASGKRYVSARLVRRLAGRLRGREHEMPHERLTDREFEVLCLLARGARLVSIAQTLGISPKTVSAYRARVLRKLGVRTGAELLRYAIEHWLVPGARSGSLRNHNT